MLNFKAVVMLLWTMLWTVIGITLAAVDPTGRLFTYCVREGWARRLLRMSSIDVKVVGAEGVDWSRPYVIVANHASQVDIPVLFAGLPTPIRFMAKRSLFFIPVFGWALYFAKFIPVDRGRSHRARKSIERGAQRIRSGPSLLVFAEGTRTPDGRIHPFKSGAFAMAIKAGVPVLPVAIRGTYAIVPKDRLTVFPGPVELVIGELIPTEGRGQNDREIVKKDAFAAVSAMFETGEPYSPPAS